ncbi:MAG TPA: YqhA family protein [Streptosporangiaceae bacterium]|nr:YqhA family protein [Streptosporangiaceae bacterium]
MTEPKPAESVAGGDAEPGLLPGTGPEPAETRRLRREFEHGLGLAQLTVLLPVVVLLISGIGAFVYGTVVAVHFVADIAGHPFAAHNLRLFLTEIDLFLIGATLLIAAFGLYELFVAKIDPASSRWPLPVWLEMNDLNDLKARVISMIILIIAVSFVDVLLEFGKALEILYLGAGVAIVIGALTVYLRFGADNKQS